MRIPSRSTARESIGIEALMVRAYREKKNHALTPLAEQLADLAGLTIAPPCLPARTWDAEAVAA